jgi:hypothetical protein
VFRTFEKDKRVVVTIQYTAETGLKPYFLTVAKRIKDSHPDVILESRILPNDGNEPSFDVIVDDKIVIGKSNARIQRLGSDKEITDSTGGISVFVSMAELSIAISKARRRRRPQTMYGKDEDIKGSRDNGVQHQSRRNTAEADEDSS